MAITLPLPVRIAAGVFATGLDRLRHLPQDLPALSVTVAGQAVRMSMRVQQEIAQLAGRGDELLAGITNRPSEHPAWATFDDEDGAADGSAVRVVEGTVAEPDPADPDPADPDHAQPGGAEPDQALRDGVEPAPPRRRAASARPSGSRPGAGHPRRRPAPAPRNRAAAEDPAGPVTARSAARSAARRDDPQRRRVTDPSTAPATLEPNGDGDGPPDMPDYDRLRLTQVRARLRGLDAAAVARLLEREQLGPARAPFLTLLANRLTTLRSGDHRDPEA